MGCVCMGWGVTLWEGEVETIVINFKNYLNGTYLKIIPCKLFRNTIAQAEMLTQFGYPKVFVARHVLRVNGWQLAKMKKSIPDMSLP